MDSGCPLVETPATLQSADGPTVDASETLGYQVAVKAQVLIGGRAQANHLTLRGWAHRPDLPQLPELWKLRAAACAIYPMYRGLARLVGMEVLDGGTNLESQFAALKQHWNDYDFFFIHFKYTDSTGEDGDFAAKVKRTEEYDDAVPRIMALKPDVFIATGDHSTPSMLKSHSWHPVPTLLLSDVCRSDRSEAFSDGSAKFARAADDNGGLALEGKEVLRHQGR